MAPVSPDSLVGATASSVPEQQNRVIVQGSGGAELSPGGRFRDGPPAPDHQRGMYSVDLRYQRLLKGLPGSLGVHAYGTNVGLQDWGAGAGASFRFRLKINPKLTLAPMVGFGSYGADLNVALARRLRSTLSWYSVLGVRAAFRGFAAYGGTGFYHPIRPRFGMQYMVGLSYYLVLDGIGRVKSIQELSDAPQGSPRIDYGFRFFSPHLSVGPVFSF